MLDQINHTFTPPSNIKYLNSKVPKDYSDIWTGNPDGFGSPSKDILGYILEGVTQSRTLVDIASGNGRYAIELARNPKLVVTAIEISSTGRDLIDRRAKEEGLVVTAIQADILTYTECNQYDLVVSSGLLEELENVKDQADAIKKMQSMVKPEGRIILRYCLKISNRKPEQRTNPDFVRYFFGEDCWNILTHFSSRSTTNNTKSTINDGENTIQTQTLVATKR
ncbi:MAG: class I SAM-dependent methyltransferase [Candidatus Parcubacteria bacterium]|nr:class I SAM-dependent methyltransferase [Candidatus Paceibacterota bacterium]